MKLISKNTSDSPNNLYPVFICPRQEGFHLPSMLPKSVKSPREHGNSASAILSPSIQCICWVVVVVVLGLAKMIVIIAGIFMPVKKT